MKKRSVGRPPLVLGKRDRKIDVRFTNDEFESILKLEKTLGVSRTELIRKAILLGSGRVIINAAQLISALDEIGAEMGRSGNNINQLARYANSLNRQGILSVVVTERFNLLLSAYQQNQKKLEMLMRRIIRLTVK